MKKSRLVIPAELLTTIDVMNTLGGGTTEPSIQLKAFPTHRRITIRIPGVSLDHVKVEVNNNQLLIYYFNILRSQGNELRFKRVLYDKSIPYFVDASKITAEEEKLSVVVKLPFNELANGEHREISINR